MHLLREYTRVARHAHFCDCCHQDILPGERYNGLVWVFGDGTLIVQKQHYDPCEDPHDPFDEGMLEEWDEPEYEAVAATIFPQVTRKAA
jgi:hypothetical protein